MTSDPAQFGSDWLALREPADHVARSARLTGLLDGWLGGQGGVVIVDLGAGSGSNLRYLAPRLRPRQRWRLVDHDPVLLERARATRGLASADGETVQVQTQLTDLADRPLADLGPADLVTATALFDLVSADWIKALADHLAATRAAGLFSLTVDGRRWFSDPEGQRLDDELDREMETLFNAHQRRAKGLGQALGPDAAQRLPELLEAAGLRVWSERADWQLAAGTARTRRLGASLLDDWASAAIEQTDGSPDRIRSWQRERQQALERGDLGLGVGHIDVLALPPRRD